MTSEKTFDELTATARPMMLKLAHERRLIDVCFKEFHQKVYPNASPDQVSEMRTCFFAGASDLYLMLLSYLDPGVDDVTDTDMSFMENINQELGVFHRRTMQAASATAERPS